jgi:uncharacterized protein YutE (UPF0331/DUF86 family)/predicted nucleotidyltransferase
MRHYKQESKHWKYNSPKIKVLKEYFNRKESVVLAFLFGSRSKNLERKISDWDIGVYFKPKEYLELETKEDYSEEKGMWSDLVEILETDEVDLVILNRARPTVVYNALRTGIPLAMKDKKLYFDLLCKVSYEAIDWWKFIDEYFEIREKAKSLSPEIKALIKERIVFLEEELKDIERFKNLSWKKYQDDRNERRNIERWVENLVMTSIDIAKIILSSEKKEIPQSYQDTLKIFTALYTDFDENLAEEFSEFAKLRNVVAHQYLDIKWKKIKNFVREAEKLYSKFMEKVKILIK